MAVRLDTKSIVSIKIKTHWAWKSYVFPYELIIQTNIVSRIVKKTMFVQIGTIFVPMKVDVPHYKNYSLNFADKKLCEQRKEKIENIINSCDMIELSVYDIKCVRPRPQQLQPLV